MADKKDATLNGALNAHLYWIKKYAEWTIDMMSIAEGLYDVADDQ